MPFLELRDRVSISVSVSFGEIQTKNVVTRIKKRFRFRPESQILKILKFLKSREISRPNFFMTFPVTQSGRGRGEVGARSGRGRGEVGSPDSGDRFVPKIWTRAPLFDP